MTLYFQIGIVSLFRPRCHFFLASPLSHGTGTAVAARSRAANQREKLKMTREPPPASGIRGAGPGRPAEGAFFIFQFRFLQKYIFIFEIYRNIPRPPRCRAVGAFLLKISRKFCARAPGGPVARQRGGRPPRPASSSTKLWLYSGKCC